MHLQACMLGQYYFQFSYWPEPSTLPGLRCWLTGLLSLPLASPASHLSLAASLPGWPAGVENQPFDGSVGTGGGDGRGCGEDESPGRSSMH